MSRAVDEVGELPILETREAEWNNATTSELLSFWDHPVALTELSTTKLNHEVIVDRVQLRWERQTVENQLYTK